MALQTSWINGLKLNSQSCTTNATENSTKAWGEDDDDRIHEWTGFQLARIHLSRIRTDSQAGRKVLVGGTGCTRQRLNMPSETAMRIELPPSKEARAPKHKGGRESSSEGIPSPRHRPAPHLNMGYYHQDAKELLGFDNMEEAPKDWNADILQEYELNSCCKCSRICHTEDELHGFNG